MTSSNGRRRVVVTGMGVLSPLGNSVDEMGSRAVEGESRMARFSQFAVAASKQAVAQAGLDLDSIDRSRAGAVCGNGGGGMPETDNAMRTILGRGGMKVDPLYVAKFLPNMAAGNVTIQLG